MDHALPAVGLGLLLLGVTALPPALTLGWAVLALAFFAWVAEADGLAVPRPGRAPIRTYGCWETPLAFTVRHGVGSCSSAARKTPGVAGGRASTRSASGRPALGWTRAGSFPSDPGAGGP